MFGGMSELLIWEEHVRMAMEKLSHRLYDLLGIGKEVVYGLA